MYCSILPLLVCCSTRPVRYSWEWEEDLGVAIPRSNVMWARPFDHNLYSVPDGEQPPEMLVDEHYA